MGRFFIDSLWEESDNAGVVYYHIVLFVMFTIIRVFLLLNVTAHYESGTNMKIERYQNMSLPRLIFEAAYMSIMAQTAWGLLDLIPVSVAAKSVNMIQTVLSFLITGGILTMKLKGKST